ncbi:hypothetical protein B0T14DRAFT_24384 [Immersiella caudata]|uniref:Uncharacterized protein n=1 Tax=Immersiella caudata TaxID=314043 RepID=A0AA39XFG6_9PEZI|nr:hypothetical protein B0T14DRAFT_24384 [Immersiella caudata]
MPSLLGDGLASILRAPAAAIQGLLILVTAFSDGMIVYPVVARSMYLSCDSRRVSVGSSVAALQGAIASLLGWFKGRHRSLTGVVCPAVFSKPLEIETTGMDPSITGISHRYFGSLLIRLTKSPL